MSILLAILLIALWTAAWLHWFFAGELRHVLFAYFFPPSWRGGRTRSDILLLSEDDFELFLNAESPAPYFVVGVLSCPGCFSTYVSAVGTTLAVFAFSMQTEFFIIPLLWAVGAWVGHRLFNYA